MPYNELDNCIKIINNIPVWDHRKRLDGLFGVSNIWEVKEFTPADALLVKCGKNV